MTQIDAQAALQNAEPYQPTGNSVESLGVDFYLELILQELQNQDPTDPTDTNELISQTAMLREISASDQMIATLDAVLVGQNVSTASGLIGNEVEGLDDAGRRVTGTVQQVTINDGAPLLEVAVATSAEASSRDGSLEPGAYRYEIAWESDGVTYSVQAAADTEDFGDGFNGSIRIENLPNTSVPKTVYRTDGSGSGDLKRVGTLASGTTTTFTDTLADDDLGAETLTGARQVVQYAGSVEVPLNNISRVTDTR